MVATVSKKVPIQSIFAFRVPVCPLGMPRKVQRVPNAVRGSISQKMARQERYSTHQPPTMGPSREPTEVATNTPPRILGWEALG